jgi:hypothetical protein
MSNNLIPQTSPEWNESAVQIFDGQFGVTYISGNHPGSAGAVILPSQGLVALNGSNGTGGLYVQLPEITSGLPGAATAGNDGQVLTLVDVVGKAHTVFGTSATQSSSGAGEFVFGGTTGEKTDFLALGGTWIQTFKLANTSSGVVK